MEVNRLHTLAALVAAIVQQHAGSATRDGVDILLLWDIAMANL